MSRYRMHIATSDGALDSLDGEGITLDWIDAVQILLTEIPIEAGRD